MNYMLETESATYRITSDGKVYTKSKIKIPIVGKGMEHTGEFKIIVKPERLLAIKVNNRGYKSVRLAGKTCMVHRLVAQAFIANPEAKPFVNHIDGNKLNNHYTNLEWCTCAENLNHARDTGLIDAHYSGYKLTYNSEQTKKNSLANLKDKTILTDEQVRYCRRVYIPRHREFGASALAREFGVSNVAMSNAVNGKSFKNIK